MRNCALCLKNGPHFHIEVENGLVTTVTYISTKDYWDRELPKDEYTVHYHTRVQSTEPVIRRVLHAVKQTLLAFRRKSPHTWLTPKVYQGMSQAEKDWLNEPYE
jgi:hypothetical protein